MNSKKLKVAIIAEYPLADSDLISKGGVINAVYWLIEGMRNNPSLDVYVLSPCKVDKEVVVRKDNITIIHFKKYFAGFDSLFLFSGLYFAIQKYLRKINPDILHAQGYPDVIFSALRCKTLKVVTIHGIFENEFKVAVSKSTLKEKVYMKICIGLEKLYTKKIPNVISISKQIENLVKNRNSLCNIYTISNAIDDQYFNVSSKFSEKSTILFVALIRYRKGLHILTEAMEELCKCLPEVQLRIVGNMDADPEYIDSIQKKHSELINKKNMVFLGGLKQSELIEEFSKCWVLCLPSFAESSPLVISQAHAVGKPVVASRVGGIPDMIVENQTGYLVEPSNAEQLKNTLQELLSDKNRCEKMGLLAKQYAVEHYYSKTVADKTIDVYNSIVNANKI